jgi:alpha-tubulin suppressor-like RCC1 family protein
VAVQLATLATLLVTAAPASAYIATAWGSNVSGQLGNGTNTSSAVPVAVRGITGPWLSGVTAVAAGNRHSLALTESPSVLSWGSNARGQLGNTAFAATNVPTGVAGSWEPGPSIAAGGEHGLALERNGFVYAWGDNESGQLGIGTTADAYFAERTKVPPKNAIAIAAGGEHSLALLQSHSVLAWGSNARGQLGNGSASEESLEPVPVGGPAGVTTAIAAGDEHSLALTVYGTVLAWGDNVSGQLGNGTTTTSNLPVSVSGLSGVTAIAAGAEHSLALLEDGTVKAWGRNASGQLGNGTYTDSNVPVAVSGLSGIVAIAAGGEFSLALRSDGTVMAWGDNEQGELGRASYSEAERNTPAPVLGLSGVKAIAAGEAHALAFGDSPPPPAVSGVLPGEGSASGGTWVNVTGANLNLATRVQFGSTSATSFTVNSPSSITAVAPAGTGVVDVTVTTPGGTSAASPGDQFSYLPSVSAVSPPEGNPSGGTEVTITGRNLGAASAVKFGSSGAAKFTVNSETSITAISPPGTGTVDITVTTPGGTSAASPGDQYAYAVSALRPAVSGVSPREAPAAASVTITGTHFLGAAAVKFGANRASSFTVNAEGTSITAVAPAGTGTVDVTVTTPAGTSATNAGDRFSYVAPRPSVTGVKPNEGPAKGGSLVTVAGTGFLGASAVSFGGIPASSFTVISDGTIVAQSPEYHGEREWFQLVSYWSVDVTVTTPGGESASTPADKFTFIG